MPSSQTQLFAPPQRGADIPAPLLKWLFSLQYLLPMRTADTSAGSYLEALPPAGLNSTTGQSNQNQELIYIKTTADVNTVTINGAASGAVTLTKQFDCARFKSDGTNWYQVALQGSGASGVTSVFGRTGVVTAQAADYAVAQVTGAAPLASPALTGNPTAPTQAANDNSTKIATTAYVDAAVAAGGGSGSIAIGTPTVLLAGSTLQVSTEGVNDWMVITSTGGSAVQLEVDPTIWHWKLLDGRMRKSFKLYAPTGTITLSTPVSNLAITGTHFDDGHDAGTAATADLNANTGAFLLTANSFTPFTGWGFAFQAPARKTSQTLNLYFAFSPGAGVAAGQASIVARLSDGSFADQTQVVSAVVTGVKWYKCPITFKAGSDGAQLSVAVYSTVYGDSGQQLGFQAATLF